jgi:COP9 signalosome complex subunit 2
VYTLEIQLHSLRRDTRRLKELYHKALRIKSGIPHPRTMAVLQECGGKMYMEERDFDRAIEAFFQVMKQKSSIASQLLVGH